MDRLTYKMPLPTLVFHSWWTFLAWIMKSVLVVSLAIVAAVSSLSCPPCENYSCMTYCDKKVENSGCPVVKNVCGCCLTCAGKIGETCGDWAGWVDLVTVYVYITNAQLWCTGDICMILFFIHIVCTGVIQGQIPWLPATNIDALGTHDSLRTKRVS